MKPFAPGSVRALITAAVVTLSALLQSGPASGQKPVTGYGQIPRDGSTVVGAYIPRELELLPKYCMYAQAFRENVPGGNDKAELARWEATLGPTFHHVHHYCYGLMNETRALLAREERTRGFYWNNAVLEFDYVLQRTTPDFILMPELLTKRGDSLLRLGQIARGLESIEQAIAVKGDYWPAYARLSDYYADAGDIEQARESLNRGLAAVPNSKTLQQRLAELNERVAGREPKGRRNDKASSGTEQARAKRSSPTGEEVTR
jgi:tetratricopeptide (TPR) repeat protein